MVAQRYETQNGLNELISYLKSKLDTNARPTAVHKLLTRFQLETIFTTNYDDLLERTFRNAGKAARPFDVVISDSDLALSSKTRLQIIKLCGSLGRAESMVVTQTQFNNYRDRHLSLAGRLRMSLETRTALFLGYNLRDPFFNQIWDNIGLAFDDLRRRSYAVMFDADQATTEDLKRRNIQVINLRAQGRAITPRLAKWLEELQHTLRRKWGGQGLAFEAPQSSSEKRTQVQPIEKTHKNKTPSARKLIKVEIGGVGYDGRSMTQLYESVLRALVDQGHLAGVELPLRTSASRYLLANQPTHPNGNPFVRPVSYGGYYLEANKSRESGVAHLKRLVKMCGLSFRSKA